MMTVTKNILEHIQALPESFKEELLDFIEYLELKNKKAEESDWSALSISSAMHGMEKEPSPYSVEDLKERF